LAHKILKNLIFDLGGVIINLDFNLTIEKFAHYTDNTPNLIIDSWRDNFELFSQYEIGAITHPQFISGIQKMYQDISEDKINEAWCAMLLDLPFERLEMLKRLKQKYNLVLLSNTNHQHIESFNQILDNAGIDDFHQHFHQVYYSYEIGLRKPEAEVFEFVLEQHNFEPDQTMFIDDSIENCDAAEALGMQVYRVTRNQLPLDFLDNGAGTSRPA